MASDVISTYDTTLETDDAVAKGSQKNLSQYSRMAEQERRTRLDVHDSDALLVEGYLAVAEESERLALEAMPLQTPIGEMWQWD